MGIDNFISRVCTQTAVYWGSPVNDGANHFTFAAPVEIKCRWTVQSELFINVDGQQDISYAIITVLQDLDYGYLFLGTLNDLDSIAYADPSLVEDAHKIRKISKIPSLDGRTFKRKVYLSEQRFV